MHLEQCNTIFNDIAKYNLKFRWEAWHKNKCMDNAKIIEEHKCDYVKQSMYDVIIIERLYVHIISSAVLIVSVTTNILETINAVNLINFSILYF